MISVSFIIITRNRKQFLKQCLDSLFRTYHNTREIIIIDNASSDDTLELRKKYKHISVITWRKNRGPVAARNAGLKKAKGKFLVFLDDDAYIKKDPFSQIIRFMEKNQTVGIVGPKLLYPNGRVQSSTRQFPTLCAILWQGTFFHRIFPNVKFYKKYLMKDFDHSTVREVDWVLGACQIIRKDVFDSIGAFDEKYFMYYGEDIDFCYRAKKAGWKIVYYPYSTVYHHYARESAKGVINRLKVEHIKSIIRFFYKRISHRYN